LLLAGSHRELNVKTPNIVSSGLSTAVTEQGHRLRIDIYRLEHEAVWTLEIINEKGTSTVWEEPFPSDQAALDEFHRTLKEEGVVAFLDGGNVIPFRRK
jgi:uncharacterized protein